MTDGEVFVVSGEPLHPSTHGGRIRTAGIAREIGRRMPVRVVAPLEAAPEGGLPFEELPPALPMRPLMAAVNAAPRLGQLLLDVRRRDVLRQLIGTHKPRAVVFAQSYLAAMLAELETAMVVDFSDVEVRRMASLARRGGARARTAFWLESRKARHWEPAVARRSALCTTPSEADVALLQSWGATAIHLPHGADVTEKTTSPADGPVTFVASFSYGPNRQAAAFLIEKVWPRLQRAEPALRLRLVGRHADRQLRGQAERAGVEVVGDPEDTDPYYRQASLIVAPIQSGGGSQVKVTEALAHARVVVASQFSATGAPERARGGLVLADGPARFAASVGRLWRDLDERRQREASLLRDRLVPTWQETCAPLVDALTAVASRL